MKTIGLIGGMSWQSTAIYYELINGHVQRRLGGLHSARMLLSSLDMAPIAAMQTDGRWEAAGELLALEAGRLESAGADVIALATNTMHKCARPITDAIRVPFLHIADPLLIRLHEDGRRRPLLLATRFTMEDRFLIERLEARGVAPRVPAAEGRVALHRIIYEELCKGIVTESARQQVSQLIGQARDDGADSVILGCTEVCMATSSAASVLPIYDTTAIHATALAEFCLSRADSGLHDSAVS